MCSRSKSSTKTSKSNTKTCGETDDGKNVLAEENKKLKDEINHMKGELHCLKQKQLNQQKYGSGSCGSLNNEEKRKQLIYLEEINILSAQLRDTFETMSKIESVNKQLAKELLGVRCQYKKLQEDLHNQAALDEYTFKKVEKAIQEKKAGLFDKCDCKKDAAAKEKDTEIVKDGEQTTSSDQKEKETVAEETPAEAIEEVAGDEE